MSEKKNIVWLASYPKSGNTWFRVFLSNLFSESSQPASINDLHHTPIASVRQSFDEITGLPSSDLTFEEVDRLRPEVYRFQAKEAGSVQFRKVHDAYTRLNDGSPLFPPDVSKAVVYFIRNPLDVLISFAHHSGTKPEKMINVLNDPCKAFGRSAEKLFNQLRQKLGTWSGHVKSWVDQVDIPVHVMRYEDMRRDAFPVFKEAVNFLNLNVRDKDIREALQNSDFSLLQKQEKEQGFKEKMINASAFFRKGKPGEWRTELTREQITIIVNEHREMMKRFGYLDDEGNVVE
ncbi:MAG: sulfotransferase domain-containing protein [Bacteroidales bacterium]|nr:sulfotransferase domain-containing protein [Bacteroidales bacterium]